MIPITSADGFGPTAATISLASVPSTVTTVPTVNAASDVTGYLICARARPEKRNSAKTIAIFPFIELPFIFSSCV